MILSTASPMEWLNDFAKEVYNQIILAQTRGMKPLYLTLDTTSFERFYGMSMYLVSTGVIHPDGFTSYMGLRIVLDPTATTQVIRVSADAMTEYLRLKGAKP